MIIKEKNFDINQLVSLVESLSPQEKTLINDALWSGSYQVPEEHQKIVSERKKLVAENPKRLLDWDKAVLNLK